MATIRKTSEGTYRVEVYVSGIRDSATRDTKGEAKAWAEARATELRAQATTGIDPTRTVAEALRKYSVEISTKKRGCRWEQVRLKLIERTEVEIGGKPQALGTLRLATLDATHVVKYRDARLKVVSGSAVNRELNLLSHVFTIARREWKWINASPTTDCTRPKENAPRVRRITPDEIDRLCLALGFRDGEIAATKMQRLAVAFLFAIETAMRKGEIFAIERVKPRDPWTRSANGDKLHQRSWLAAPTVVFLGSTKNGHARSIPLSPRAQHLLTLLPMTGPLFFGLEVSAADALFRKYLDRAGIDDLHFHDTRHEAISRLAKQFAVLDLARITGHRNINQLQTYYHVDAAELAERMAR